MNVHIFGAKCSPTCAQYALRRTALDKVTRFNQEVLDVVTNSFCVDNMIHSTRDETSATRSARKLIEPLRHGGFRSTKWMSNSRDVLSSIPNSERPRTELNLDLDAMPVERVLGCHWNAEDDNLVVAGLTVLSKLTKRGVLKTLTSIYDPLGCLSPYIMVARHLMQDLCKQNLN